MAEINRYEGGNVQKPQGFSSAGASTAVQQVANAQLDLASRLEGFSTKFTKMAMAKAGQEAVDQAAKDDAEGVPFHRESVHTAYGQAYNEFRTASYAAEAEIDLSAKATEYAEKFKMNPQGFADAYTKYYEKMASQAPTGDLQSVVSITGRKTLNHVRGQLVSAQNARIASDAKDRYAAWLDLKKVQLVNASSQGDMKTVHLIENEMNTYTNTMVSQGLITQQNRVDLEKKTRSEVLTATLEQTTRDLIEKGDIQGAMNQYNAFQDKIPETMTIAEHKATVSSLNSIIASAKKAQNAQIKELKKHNDIKATEEIKVLDSNKIVKNPMSDEEIALLDPSKQRALEISRGVKSIRDKYAEHSLQDQEKLLADWEATPEADALGVEFVSKLRASIAADKKQWKDDPIGKGVEDGIIVNVGSVDIRDLPNSAKVLIERQKQSGIIEEETGTYNNKLLRPAEAQQLSQYVSSATIEEKLTLANQVAGLGEEIATKVFKQIDDKTAPMMTFVGDMIVSGNVNAARKTLFGVGSDVKVPGQETESVTASSVADRLAGAMTGYTSDEVNRISRGIVAYGQGTLVQDGKELTEEEMIKETVGELVQINGRSTILPYNVEETDFVEWLDNIQIDGYPGITKGLQDMTDTFGAGNLQLIKRSDTEYVIINKEEGVVEADKDGKPFIIKYPKGK